MNKNKDTRTGYWRRDRWIHVIIITMWSACRPCSTSYNQTIYFFFFFFFKSVNASGSRPPAASQPAPASAPPRINIILCSSSSSSHTTTTTTTTQISQSYKVRSAPQSVLHFLLLIPPQSLIWYRVRCRVSFNFFSSAFFSLFKAARSLARRCTSPPVSIDRFHFFFLFLFLNIKKGFSFLRKSCFSDIALACSNKAT